MTNLPGAMSLSCAALTAVLFTIGKFLLGLYLGYTSTASSFGAAGSFVVMLVWVYYSAQILLFGAEFTRLYSLRRGSGQQEREKQADGNPSSDPDAPASQGGPTRDGKAARGQNGTARGVGRNEPRVAR